MVARLDFRQPTIVVAGYWNDVILNEPGWVAKHLLGIAEGEQVNLEQILAGNQIAPNQIAPGKQIWMYDEFGICCSGPRLEVYLRDAENLGPVYDMIALLGEKLPHTPASALGVNFHFVLDDDVSATTALFETAEAFDTVGTIRSQERTDIFELSTECLIDFGEAGKPSVQLKMNRSTEFRTVHIDMNYHQDLSGLQMLDSWRAMAPVEHWKAHAESLIQSCYGIDEITASYF